MPFKQAERKKITKGFGNSLSLELLLVITNVIYRKLSHVFCRLNKNIKVSSVSLQMVRTNFFVV